MPENRKKTEELLPDAGALQRIFDSSGVRIDLAAERGFENFYSRLPDEKGGACRRTFPPEPGAPLSDDEREERRQRLGQALTGKSGEQIYVFAEGEEYPRPLRYEEGRGYRLGKPLDQTAAPAKPKYFGFKKLMNRLFGGFKSELAEYDRAEKAHQEAQQLKAAFGQARAERTAGVGQRRDGLYRQAAAETGEELDAMYAELEQNTLGEVSRRELIEIDGVTVESLMLEEYRKTLPEDVQARAFSQFSGDGYQAYLDSHPGRVTEMVTAARLSGRHVQMHVVDPETLEMEKNSVRMMEAPDWMKKEPKEVRSALSALGEQQGPSIPSVEEEGIYGSLYQRMNDTSTLVEEQYANKRMMMAHPGSPVCKNRFFGAWEQETGRRFSSVKNSHGFSADRSVMSSLAVCHMVRQGYPVEEIFDPAALPEEKAQCGREVIGHMENDDLEWLIETNLKGRQALNDYAQECLRRTDFSENGTPFTDQNRRAHLAMETSFDMLQEYRHIAKESKEYLTEQRGSAEAAEQEIAKTQNDLDSMMFAREMMTGRQNAVEIALGYQAMDDLKAVSHILTGEVCRQTLSERSRVNPEMPPNVGLDTMDYIAVTGQGMQTPDNPGYAKMTEFKSPRDVQNYGRAAACDILHRRFDCKYDQSQHRFFVKDRTQPAAPAADTAPQRQTGRQYQK